MGTIRKVKIRSCGNYTFKELFDIFKLEKRAYGISEKTIRNYFETLNKFCKELDLQNPQINQITKEDIYYFINQLNDNGSRVATINHYLRELKAFFHWAYDSGYLNEKIDIKLIKAQEVIKETYSEEELQKLLVEPKENTFTPWRSWAVINWILATGNRERTVCNIKIKDLNFQEREILLQQTKNKKVQIIPMSSELSLVLKKYIRLFRSEADPNDYLFCNIAGEKLTERALIKSIRVYNHSRGVSRTSIHAFRHTFAKYWIRNNGDPFRLQKMLGHSSLDMTRNYVNMFSADLKDGFDSFSPLDKMVKKTGTKHKIKKKITTLDYL